MASAPRRLPFTAFTAFPALFQAYAAGDDALRDFLPGAFAEAATLATAADRVAAHPRPREAVAAVLAEQNAAWGADDAARDAAHALARPGTLAVVTGQQLGLFGGPLYTMLKTITTLQLARHLAAVTGRTVVPVFWLEGEDHDFDEVAAVHVLRGNALETLRYAPAPAPEGPVGRHRLTPAIEEVLSALEALLPPTDFRPALLEALRAAYRPGTPLVDAFARFWHSLFAGTGLVLLNPDDARLKRHVAPLFRREIDDGQRLAAEVEALSERLAARFHAQVRVRPSNLFLLEDGGRHALDAEAGGFRKRGAGTVFTPEALRARLEAAPEDFSPNVVLRPLAQDTLLPTAAYVAGPGEVSYFAQLGPAYAWAGLPMPVVYPRASATLVEAKVEKVLDRLGLTVADLAEERDRLFRRFVVARMAVDVEARFAEATGQVHAALDALKPEIAEVDPTLAKAAEATRATLVRELDRLKERVVKAEKRGQDEVRAQIEKAQANVFPEGRLQERVLSPLYFLNKYGLDLPQRLAERLTLDTTAHQVLTL